MNLSRLKWLKVVTPPADYSYHWAYSSNEIQEWKEKEQIIHRNGLTIFPLGFKNRRAESPAVGDLMTLTQRAKITHIVEFLDDNPYEGGGWFHRYVKVVWWEPEMNWDDLPHRQEVLGFDISVQQGIPYEFSSFTSFQERWGGKGGLDKFREHLADKLVKHE